MILRTVSGLEILVQYNRHTITFHNKKKFLKSLQSIFPLVNEIRLLREMIFNDTSNLKVGIIRLFSLNFRQHE